MILEEYSSEFIKNEKQSEIIDLLLDSGLKP
jgi:hypothetical protein